MTNITKSSLTLYIQIHQSNWFFHRIVVHFDRAAKRCTNEKQNTSFQFDFFDFSEQTIDRELNITCFVVDWNVSAFVDGHLSIAHIQIDFKNSNLYHQLNTHFS